MSIAFSGGPIVNNTFAGATTSALIAGIQTALTSAGWTVVSGGGTTNLQMQTVLTPQNLQMRFRFHDNAITVSSTATVQISMSNVGGSIVGVDNSTSAPWIRVNASTNFRVIAGPYYFWILIPTDFSSYGYVAYGGVPWIASFQTPSTTTLGYLVTMTMPPINGNTNVPNTFRNSNKSCGSSSSGGPLQQLLYNSTYVSTDGNQVATDAYASLLKGWFPAWQADIGGSQGVAITSSKTNQFSDGSFTAGDPWLAWGIQRATFPINSDPSTIMGMLWDAVFIYDSSQAGDSTTTFDGHNWYAISNAQTPTLWVATT